MDRRDDEESRAMTDKPVLTLYNTLTRQKEPFAPIDANNVRMYVCGPTVYDFAHIGNARPAIVFDVLFRLLRHVYGEDHVTYVRNITDVDDKINARALRDYGDQVEAGKMSLNEAIRAVTEKTLSQYHEDVAALGCLEPTVQPRATEHIDGMVAMIQTLIDQRPCLCRHRKRGQGGAVRRRLDAGLWRPVEAQSRRAAGRRPHRRRGAQEEPGRFRAVEGILGDRARLGRRIRHRRTAP